MKFSSDNLSIDEINTLACLLGEIQRHITEDTDLLAGIERLKINLSSEIDGYDCLIKALYELQCFVDKNI
jgi:hypothetical protein